MAQSVSAPTDAQYSSTLQLVTQGGGGPGGGGGDSSSGGGLPFTGLDVALLAAIAVVLTVAGLVLRRQRPASSGPQA